MTVFGYSLSQRLLGNHFFKSFSDSFKRVSLSKTKYCLRAFSSVSNFSGIEYADILDLEKGNDYLSETDLCLVIGANDVVNPAAENNPGSPIYGMPILQAYKAKHIIVNKRSMNAGYAGIENDLFYDPKTSMFFGDAKKALTELLTEIKTL